MTTMATRWNIRDEKGREEKREAGGRSVGRAEGAQ